jgi:twitching motility protein PilT
MAVLSQTLIKRIDTRGMCASYEFMVVTPAIAHLIRDNKSFRIDSAIQTGKKFGMQLLDDHLWSQYEQGMISAEDMIDRAKSAEQLIEKVHRAGGQVGRPELDDAEASPATA